MSTIDTTEPAVETPPEASDHEALAQAQRERDPASVGPTQGLAANRLVTADEGDAHRDWTVQSGVPFPQADALPPTRFHPEELPNPARAVEAGLIPRVLPDLLVDSAYRTQPPSENLPYDHPLRAEFRAEDEDSVNLNSNVVSALKSAERQKAGESAVAEDGPESNDAASGSASTPAIAASGSAPNSGVTSAPAVGPAPSSDVADPTV